MVSICDTISDSHNGYYEDIKWKIKYTLDSTA